jgi:hypothetical protein
MQKNFTTTAEFQYRFQLWQKADQVITQLNLEAQNKPAPVKVEFAHNFTSDLSDQEFANLVTGLKIPGSEL